MEAIEIRIYDQRRIRNKKQDKNPTKEKVKNVFTKYVIKKFVTRISGGVAGFIVDMFIGGDLNPDPYEPEPLRPHEADEPDDDPNCPSDDPYCPVEKPKEK